jgi:hypothetical protein
MRHKRGLLALLSCCLIFHGCIAAEFGMALEAEGAIATEGAEMMAGLAEVEAEGGIAAEIAAEAAESGRLLAPRGALTRALGELAETDSVVTIDRLGRITQQGRYLATIESDGTLTAEAESREFVVGRVKEGELYEVSSAGARPVARLRGFVPSRGIRLMTGPGASETTVEVLHSQVAAEILEVRDGWYEIRLPNGATGWIWAPAIAALLIERGSSQSKSCQCVSGPGAILLKTGEIIQYSECREDGGAITLHSTDGRTATIDSALVAEILCGNDARIPVAGTRVELSSGIVLYADTIASEGSAVVITTHTGERLSTDQELVIDPVPLRPTQ